MATSPTQRKSQPLRVDSSCSGKPESESSRGLSDCPAVVVAQPTSSSDGVSLKIEVPYSNDARRGSAPDDPIGPVPHACSNGNIIIDRMRSSSSGDTRGRKSSDTAQSSSHGLLPRHSSDTDARAPRSFEREPLDFAGDKTFCIRFRSFP